MTKRKGISMLAALSIVSVAAGAALAHGRGGRGGPGGDLFLLTRAAGITHQQIAAAFKADANLRTDRANLKNARDNLATCMVSGGSCTGQISAFSTALGSLANEKLTVWNGLFRAAGAANDKQAATVLGELQKVRAERKSIFLHVFGSQTKDDRLKD
jgi:hypothetical protein